VITRANIYFGGYNISAHKRAFEVSPKVALHETTTVEDTAVTRVGGNITSSISGEGYWNSTPDTALRGNLGTSQPMSFCITDNTEGNDAILVNCLNASYNFGAAAGDVLPFTFSGEGSGRPVGGKVMCVNTIESATTEASTARQIGAVAAGYVAYANLHIISFTGDSLDVALQSCATEGGSYDDRITFTTAGAIGGEYATDTSADTDTWWKVSATAVGGSVSISYIVTLGIALA